MQILHRHEGHGKAVFELGYSLRFDIASLRRRNAPVDWLRGGLDGVVGAEGAGYCHVSGGCLTGAVSPGCPNLPLVSAG